MNRLSHYHTIKVLIVIPVFMPWNKNIMRSCLASRIELLIEISKAL